ncbi:MAG: HesA/MoeB/ThiF family protein, partial [Candidatus Poseidoniaceae archaeon]|nr:HesA/MoeB/ThiF family protein [Candidatus Poseidoniaceae archaeon]
MVDLERHSRHILLPQVGAEGQNKLSKSRVLCLGAGGLGSPVIQYLAAAGIGHLTIVDDDVVEISNLQRQVIHRTSDVGVPKAQSAQRFVNELDPNISVDAIEVRVDQNNAKELFEGHHLIVDGTDNIPTRYLIDETCNSLGIPWVYGSIYRFEGQVSVFNFNGGPTYQDLFPEAPPDDLLPSCAEAGVLGVLPGLIGSLQANEVIKIIVGIGQPLSGQLLIYDALESSQKILKFGNSVNEHVEEPSATQSQVMFHE